MRSPEVSIVIPTFKRNEDLFRLLYSIETSDFPLKRMEIVVVDNGNERHLKQKLAEDYPEVKLIEPGSNLYSNAAFKLGSKYTKGKYIFLLDDDNILEPSCIRILAECLDQHESFGMVGPLMMIEDTNEVLSVGGKITSLGINKYLHMREELADISLPPIVRGFDYLHNARMVRKDVLERVPFDDKTFPHNWAETDFSFRVTAAGYDLATITSAVERHMGQNAGWLTRIGPYQTYDQAKSRILFRRRFRSNFVEWIKFWLLIFPPSSVMYFWRILNLPSGRIQTIKAYFKGTRDGIFQKMNNIVE